MERKGSADETKMLNTKVQTLCHLLYCQPFTLQVWTWSLCERGLLSVSIQYWCNQCIKVSTSQETLCVSLQHQWYLTEQQYLTLCAENILTFQSLVVYVTFLYIMCCILWFHSLIRLKDNICLIWKPAILLCQHTSLPVSSCVYAPSQRAFHYHHYSKWSHISLKNVSQFGRSNALKLCCQHTVAQHLSKALVTQA